MNTLESNRAAHVMTTGTNLIVSLVDGRVLFIPLAWYPRLAQGTLEERDNWELIGLGEGIHWPDLDEDISVQGLLLGRRSAESQESIERWLAGRSKTAVPA